MTRPLRIFTWPVHGNYFWYLSQCRHEFFVPVRDDGAGGYSGRGNAFPFPDSVHEVAAEDVGKLSLDCVLYQSHDHWLRDRFSLLTESQRRLPAVILEHDPPRDQ